VEGFAPAVAEALGFYVYLLIDPADGSVFYVGKGTGNRCFAHLRAARLVPDAETADFAKLAKIRAIEARGDQVRIDILRHGMDEPTAFAVEQASINLLEGSGLTNIAAGHDAQTLGRMSVAEVNALYGASPVQIAAEDRCILIRINRLYRRGIDDEALYEATRKWWRVASWARKVGSAGAPTFAMAVYRGVVRAVYRIESWDPVDPQDIPEDDPQRAGRWRFTGVRDASVEERYLNRSVAAYMPAAARNPITYVPPRPRRRSPRSVKEGAS